MHSLLTLLTLTHTYYGLQCFNQQAEVFVDSESAGLWLTAGANTVVRSDPPREGGAAEPIAVTAGGRKLLQDEFLLPPELTASKTGSIVVQFVNRPHGVLELWPERGALKCVLPALSVLPLFVLPLTRPRPRKMMHRLLSRTGCSPYRDLSWERFRQPVQFRIRK